MSQRLAVLEVVVFFRAVEVLYSVGDLQFGRVAVVFGVAQSKTCNLVVDRLV